MRLPLLLLPVALLALTPLHAAVVKSPDGLTLQISASGLVTGVACGKSALPVSGRGGFAIADFQHQPEPMNLVPNGGFEAGSEGWRLGGGQTLDSAVAHGGKASARLEVPGPAPASSSLEVVVPVKPNARYRVGMWLRRHGVGVCGVYSSERDDNNALTGKQTQVGTVIPKVDDQWLPLTWEITTEPKTTRLSLRGDIYRSTGTLWLDDFFISEITDEVYEPVTGSLTGGSQGLSFLGKLPQRGLAVQATVRPQPQGCLRVDGTVSDTTGDDRALGLRFILPVNLTGYDWYDEPAESRRIVAGAPSYRYTYDCLSGTGKCSIYPWSAVCGPAAALSLALPLSDGPRTYLLEYLPPSAGGAPSGLAVTFFYGLTRAAERHPSRAPFSFVIYVPDRRWGLRSALERYYRLFPESFAKRPTFEGYLNYANLERFEPKTHELIVNNKPLADASDWGEGYKFLFHVHGCYDYRQVPYADPVRPDDKTVLGLLDKMVETEQGAKYIPYVPTAETVKKICRGPQDELLYIGDTRWWRAQEGYNHTDQPGWGLNFRVNEDPDLSPFLQEKSRKVATDYSATDHRPWDGTFTADAIEGYMSNSDALDYGREHLAKSDAPLTFGKGNLRPALVNTIWDFLDKSWQPITEQYRIATYGNANCYEQAFTLPYVDVPMTEGSWDPRHPGRLDRYLRALAHHKIWRYWHAWDASGGYGDKDPDNVRLQLQRCLQYAIYPPVYCIEGATADLEAWRGEFRQYVPAIEELSTAGWEPVPYATATGGVVVERYGSGSGLYFTLRNETDKPVATSLKLQRRETGLPAGEPLLLRDILSGLPAFTPLSGDTWSTELAPGQARAVWVGTALQAAHHGYVLAGRLLEKLDRMYYLEMTADGRAAWTRARQLCTEGAKADRAHCVSLSTSLQEALLDLPRHFPAPAAQAGPAVDLAKLTYRGCAAASHAPAALLGLKLRGARLIENGARGGIAEATLGLGTQSRRALAGVTPQVLSPWDEVQRQSLLQPAGGGDATDWQARLFVPSNPERRLLPYLVCYSGKAAGTSFTVSAPLDLVVGSPLSLSVQPQRVFRGQDRKLVLTLTNHLADPATVKVSLTPPAKTALDVSETAVQVPPGGSAAVPLLLSLQPTAFLGETRLGYAVTAEDTRFICRGSLELLVSDPVPQAVVERAAAPPRLDGRLDDPCWNRPPLAPELHLLQDGGNATETTSVWAAYDDRGLYVAFRCGESQMDRLVAKYTERGSPLYLDDDVELFIFAPRGKQVYQLAVNPQGAQSDNFGNSTAWQAAAARGDKEWTVEVFVPYAAVGESGPPPAGLPWGMQFGRQQKAKHETTSWTRGPAFIVKEGFGEIVFQ